MSMTSNVRIKLDGVTQQVENACGMAIRFMMEDIHNHSTPITPMRPSPVGGTLRASVSKQMINPKLGIIKWHAPYAEYQERGFTTGPVRNYSTPGTHAHFVEESVNQAMAKLPKFIKMGGLI